MGAWPHLIDRRLYLGKDIPIGGTAHQAGTCRFGTDPASSVLDLDCKAHELDNLYVTDASFFPSIGAVNPTLTIIANALAGRRPHQGAARGVSFPLAALRLAAAGFAVGRLPAAARPRVRALRILRISRVVSDLDRAEASIATRLGSAPSRAGPRDPATLAALGLRDATPTRADHAAWASERSRWCASRRRKPALPARQPQQRSVVPASGDRRQRHGCRLRASWPRSRLAADQRGRAASCCRRRNGGVRAFKFRDPDGHPLELIWFPPGPGARRLARQAHPVPPFLGIDHSALAIASTRRSLRFYRALGLRVSDRSITTAPPRRGWTGCRARGCG